MHLYTLLILLCLPLGHLFAHDTLRIAGEGDEYALSPLIEIMADPEAKYLVDWVAHKGVFQPISKGIPMPEAKMHWIKFSIYNNGNSFEEYKISIAFADEVLFYTPTDYGSFIWQESGDLYGINNRPVDVGQMVFVKMLVPHQTSRTFYMRVSSQTDLSQQFREQTMRSLRVYTEKGFHERLEKPRFYQAFFYGAMMIMMFYNFFIFLSLRNLDYLYYVGYLIMMSLFFVSNSGYLVEFVLPEYPRWDLYIRFLSTPLLLFFFMQFSQAYLESKRYAPILNRMADFFKYTLLLLAIAMCLGLWKFGRVAIIVVAVIAFPLVLYMAIREWRRGFTPARYFVLANILLILGGIVFALPRLVSIVQNPITQYSVQLAVVLQAALLSNGLADRINLARRKLAEETLSKERMEKQQEIERKQLIEEKNKELEMRVIERTTEVVMQKEELEQKNKNITASIRYAQRIQWAIFGNTQRITTCFSDGFVWLQPRDIVSGDFYWYGEKNGLQILIAADCTGHGVPGAFMTVMGNSLLGEIVNGMGITSPGLLLSTLDQKVQGLINASFDGHTPNDGMDMAVLVFDMQKKTAVFAGAKNPCSYIKKGEMYYIKGSPYPIGSKQFGIEKIFEQTEIPIEEGDIFYLYSDGYQDQFKGGRGNKFLSKNLRELLLKNSHLSMAEQQTRLEETFRQWKGNGFQTDDVLVMGVKI